VQTFAALVLFATTIFNIATWPTFFRRVARDERARDAQGRATSFYRVHLVLLMIGIALALASGVAGIMLITA